MAKIASNYEGGFDIAVLTHQYMDEALFIGASSTFENVKSERLLIISSDGITKPSPEVISKQTRPARKKKLARTVNRKRVTFADKFTHKGTSYRINNGKDGKNYGLYIEALQSIIEQFQIALKNWRRVFVLRFELHQPRETESSEQITKFRKRLNQKLVRKYGFDQVGYAWAREYHGKGKGQHYHFVLFLDGSLIRHSSRINEIIRTAWQYPTEDFTIGTIKRCFYFVENSEIEQEAIYRVSYLAKTRGKGHRPKQAKDFQCSRMKLTKDRAS